MSSPSQHQSNDRPKRHGRRARRVVASDDPSVLRCRYLCLVSILSGLLCHRASASFSSLNLRPSIGQKASSRSAEKRGRERERETVLAHTTARYDASTRQEREREKVLAHTTARYDASTRQEREREKVLAHTTARYDASTRQVSRNPKMESASGTLQLSFKQMPKKRGVASALGCGCGCTAVSCGCTAPWLEQRRPALCRGHRVKPHHLLIHLLTISR